MNFLLLKQTRHLFTAIFTQGLPHWDMIAIFTQGLLHWEMTAIFMQELLHWDMMP